MRKFNFATGITILLLILIGYSCGITYLYYDEKKKSDLVSSYNYDHSMIPNDTVQTKINSDSSSTAVIEAIDKDAIIASKNRENDRLRSIVKKQDGFLAMFKRNKLESASTFKTETDVHNSSETKVTKTAKCDSPVYESNFELAGEHNKLPHLWIKGNVLATKDQTTIDMQLYDEYSVVNRWDKKLKKYYAEVTTYNPYNAIKTFNDYHVKVPKRRWGISITAGAGIGITPEGRIFTGFGVFIGPSRKIIGF